MCFGVSIRVLSLFTTGLCILGQGSQTFMRQDIKVGYGLLALIFAILLALAMFVFSDWINFVASWVGCVGSTTSKSLCVGVHSAFRLSGCFVLFHILIALSCLTRDGFSKCVNEGLWGLKMFFIAGLFAGSLFIPNEYWLVYSRVAQWASLVYLFFQMVSVIDALYLWAEHWARKFSSGNNCYGCLLLFTSILMYLGAGVIIYYSFLIFWIEGCGTNKIILVSMPIFLVGFTTLILLRFHPTGSLITSGGMSLYGMFLAWNAFLSYPNQKMGTKCNPILEDKWSMWVQLGTSLLVAFVCTFYWSVSDRKDMEMSKRAEEAKAGVAGVMNNTTQGRELMETGRADYGQGRLIDDVQAGGENDYSAYEDNSYLKFHAFMLLYGFYLSPLFTNWGNTSFNASGGGFNYGDSNMIAPFVIKISIYGVGMLLYLWTIIAPQILTDRDFSQGWR